jgi:NAD(P)-dependent dehydrogenase (short-subunit alcohol dehydrogenase family)
MTSKIALVTGANKGIGKEIARSLGLLGHTVLVGSRDPGRGRKAGAELTAEGLDAHDVVLDVTDDESVAAAAKQVERDHGRLDVLVNNAAVLVEGDGPALAASVELLERTYATNVLGLVRVTQAFLPLLRRSDAGRIVNVSSELSSLALRSDPDGRIAAVRMLGYNSSKTAVNAITVAYANELRPERIWVNAADPGHCATELGGLDAPRTAAQGAVAAVRLATLGPDGPTGELQDEDGPLPW